MSARRKVSVKNRVIEILNKQEKHICLHCDGGTLDSYRRCYKCGRYVYDAEYFSAIRKIVEG